jgi:tetratricopeptide (TPR) repeat protein/CHAT domain-containing protein
MRAWPSGLRFVLSAGLLLGAIGTARPASAQSNAKLEALDHRIEQLYSAGKYAEALTVAERYVDAVRKAHGEQHPTYANAIGSLAQVLQATGRLAEAEPLYRRALAIDEKALGPEHLSVARDLNNLAEVLRATDRPAEAEPMMRRALAVAERRLGSRHPGLAGPLNNLAALLKDTNRPGEAEPFYRRALGIDERKYGPRHPTVATDLNDLALVLEATKRPAEAEPLFRRALAIDERSLGPEDANVAVVLNNLAALLKDTNRPGEAEPLYRRLLAIDEKSLGPEHPDVALHLGTLAGLLRATNRLAEAEPFYRRALAIEEKSFGPEHPNVAMVLRSLAWLLTDLNRAAEAEPLYRRALAIDEKSLGPEHPTVASDLNYLALLLRDSNRPAEAEPLYRRALAIGEKSPGHEHSGVTTYLNNLAELLAFTNRLAEAEPLYRRALAIDEKDFGPEHPNLARDLNYLALLLQDTNRLAEAEALYRRALAIDEKIYGPEHPEVAKGLNNLAHLLRATNRLAEAETLMRRTLAIAEKSLGPEHRSVAVSLNNLAGLLGATNRFSEAEPLYRRALAIDEKIFGPDNPQVAGDLNNLASLLRHTNRVDEAERRMRRAIGIFEKSLGAEHAKVATSLNNLAGLLQDTNRLAEAEPLYRRALAIDEKIFGPDHPNVAIPLNNLAGLLLITNRLSEAEPLLRRALAIEEKSYGPEHPNVARDLNNLALLRAEAGDWAESARLHRRAKPLMTGAYGNDGEDLAKAVLTSNTLNLRASARAVHRAGGDSAEAREEGFELAQWALQTGAADALAQMAVRFAKGTGPLAELVRAREDLVARRHGEDKRLFAAVGRADATAANSIRTSIAGLDGKLADLDARLAAEFPEYASLASPKPLGISAVQSLLKDDEALLLFLDVPRFGNLPEETLAWAVTKGEVRWISVPLGTAGLADRVAKLRCGLDRAEWSEQDQGWVAKTGRCRTLKPGGLGADEPLPFDVTTARELYAALLAPFADLTQGKGLIVVPSGPLTSLPFHVLVTDAVEPSGPGAMGQPSVSGANHTDPNGPAPVAWLALTRPISVLPSVGSLAALRKLPPSQAGEPYIAFGNPLLDGGEPEAEDARQARAKQRCPLDPETLRQRVAASKEVPRPGGLLRGGINLAALRAQPPLPETADELCRVAKALGALGRETETVWLGARATEANLKALSRAGVLARYRVLHFATHGVLASESEAILKAQAEPALILTPPKDGAKPADLDEDDGLLTASEVAQLNLNADWVVLSACNTAAGEKGNAEALSGLARAFFYAKARALLVSHWYVNSEAAVKLTTGAFEELRAHPEIGRAEGLRRSMARLITSGRPDEAQPEYWAPFVLVGEGAR